MISKWRLFRLGLILVDAFGVISVSRKPQQGSNFEWMELGLISWIMYVVGFIWLMNQLRRPGISWSRPHDWDEIFLPMAKYPLRYLNVVGLMSIFGGLIGSATSFACGLQNFGFALLTIIFGAGALLFTSLFRKVFWKQTGDA
jgi:hypothetical protein